jgi:hypothetical protein
MHFIIGASRRSEGHLSISVKSWTKPTSFRANRFTLFSPKSHTQIRVLNLWTRLFRVRKCAMFGPGDLCSRAATPMRSNRSGYCVRLPGGTDRHPRSVFERKIAENHVLGGYLLQRLTDHRHPKPAATEASALAAPSASLTIRGLKPNLRHTFKSQSP